MKEHDPDMNAKNKEKLASALLLPINPAAIILLGFATVLWGIWLVIPFWNVFETAQIYGIMASVASETAWGLMATSCGLVTIYGAVKRSYRPLVRGAFVATWFWLVICILYFTGDPVNTGGISALIFTVYSAYIHLNIKINHKNIRDGEDILQ